MQNPSSFLLFCSSLFLSSFRLFAAEGHTFSIEEAPFRPHLGSLPSINYEEIAEKAKTPPPVKGLGETTSYRAFFFDPTYTVPEDIQDSKGNYLARKGQTIDPMGYVSTLPDLIFFDGTNEEHIAWAKNYPKAKWILVKGSPVEVEELTGHLTFFDQMGGLTKRFGLENVPCKVSKKDHKILIEETPAGGES